MLKELLISAVLFAAPSAWAQTDPVQVTKGEKVYADKRCAICHAINGKGAKTASDLSAVGNKRDASWLKTFMKDPKAMDPKAAKMLPFRGGDEELEALAAYMSSLK